MVKLKFRLKYKDEKTKQEMNLKNNLNLGVLSSFIEQIQDFIKGNGSLDLNDLKISLNSGSLEVAVEGSESKLAHLIKDIDTLNSSQELYNIDTKRASTVRKWQSSQLINFDQNSYEIISEKSDSQKNKLIKIIISNKTNFRIPKTYIHFETYYWGYVYDMGGKEKANIHMLLENGHKLRIKADKKTLKEISENKLYKDQLMKVMVKQNIVTEKIESVRLVSFITKKYNKDPKKYEKLAKKGAKAWRDVENATDWVEEQRGNI